MASDKFYKSIFYIVLRSMIQLPTPTYMAPELLKKEKYKCSEYLFTLTIHRVEVGEHPHDSTKYHRRYPSSHNEQRKPHEEKMGGGECSLIGSYGKYVRDRVQMNG